MLLCMIYSYMPLWLDWTCLGLSAAKHPCVRPHLEGETPKNESSGGETSTCMGWIVQRRIVQGAKRPGGKTSRQEMKRLGVKRLQAQVQVLTHKHKSKYLNSKSKSNYLTQVQAQVQVLDFCA